MNDGNSIEWSEIEATASKMFAVWSARGELEWAKECWSHFTSAGLTGNANLLETTTSLLRLVTLARIYEEFCGCAWDENPETSPDDWAKEMEIDAVALGILAGKLPEADFDDANYEDELLKTALLAVTDSMRGEIFACLAQAYGNEVKLYSRMARTNHSPDDVADGDEFEVTGQNSAAYGFVTEGFRK